MKHDPKQIVTPFAFEVSPDLLGLPLATPRRRLIALFIDLIFASILTYLGSFFLATVSTILFFWLAIKNKSSSFWKNMVRFGTALFVSIFVFAITFYFTKKDSENDDTTSSTIVTLNDVELAIDTSVSVDWRSVSKQLGELSSNDSISSIEKINNYSKSLDSKLPGNSVKSGIYPDEIFTPIFNSNVVDFATALRANDTLAFDSLRTKIIPLLAFNELSEKEASIDELKKRVEILDDENTELTEEINHPSFLRNLEAAAEDFGLSIGWIGIYFILCTALFKGQTFGKRILSLKVVRLNNKPIGLLYSFERFGGYAAGLATGLLGFAQIYWDSNRQGIHDKIASTVVLDTREKTKKKYKHLNKGLTN